MSLTGPAYDVVTVPSCLYSLSHDIFFIRRTISAGTGPSAAQKFAIDASFGTIIM